MSKNKDSELCVKGMSQILKETQDNIFVYSIDGICLYTNEHLANILGLEPVGKHLRDIFPHRSEKHIQIILNDYKKIWDTQQGDFIPVQKEKLATGENRVFSVSRIPITWHDKPAISGIGKDITALFLAREETEKANEEIKAINEELKATNDMLEDTNKQLQESSYQLNKFMSYVLHDIKNPASSIAGFVEVIKKYIEDMIENKKYNEAIVLKIKTFFDYIGTSSEKILGFIEDLSQYDKIKKGNLNIKIEEIQIKDFFDRIYKQQYGYLLNINQQAKKEKLSEKEISIIFYDNISQVSPVIFSDKKLLERILSNLIGNAIKFTDKGSVSIMAEKIENLIRFSIVDTGIGIKKDEHMIVFEEFKFSSTNYDPIIKGSGLGLSIVSQIVEKLGGKMLPIQSELGKGSTFSFEIPFLN